MKKSSTTVLIFGAAVLLAACGGGDDTPAPTSSVPPSASQSVGGFITYLERLVASSADTLEPVDVSAVKPPKDDAAEPTPIP